jgi:hypothetical protein
MNTGDEYQDLQRRAPDKEVVHDVCGEEEPDGGPRVASQRALR